MNLKPLLTGHHTGGYGDYIFTVVTVTVQLTGVLVQVFWRSGKSANVSDALKPSNQDTNKSSCASIHLLPVTKDDRACPQKKGCQYLYIWAHRSKVLKTKIASLDYLPQPRCYRKWQMDVHRHFKLEFHTKLDVLSRKMPSRLTSNEILVHEDKNIYWCHSDVKMIYG